MHRLLLCSCLVLSTFLAASLRVDDEDNKASPVSGTKIAATPRHGPLVVEERRGPLVVDEGDATLAPAANHSAGVLQWLGKSTLGELELSGNRVLPPLPSLTNVALQAVRQVQDGFDDDPSMLDEEENMTFSDYGKNKTKKKVILTTNTTKKNYSYVCLTMMLLVITLYICFITCGDANAAALEEKGNELKQLEFSYIQLMTDMEGKVKKLVDMQVDWSQHVFETKKNDFVEFATRLKNNPERYGNEAAELVEPFKAFVKAWLDIFKEASMEPIDNPLVPITAAEIDACSSINAVAEVIINKLDALEIEFVDLPKEAGNKRGSVWQVDLDLESGKAQRKAFLERTQKARDMCMCSWANLLERNPLYLGVTIEKYHGPMGKSKFLFPLEVNVCRVGRIVFLTVKHFFLFVLFIVCHWVMVISLIMRADVAFVCMVFATMLMWIIMWRFEVFDLVGSLKVLAISIRSQKDAMLQKGKEIQAISEKIEMPSQIWIYRTRPKLDILSGLCRKIGSSKWPDAGNLKEFLDAVNEGLEGLTKSCGSLLEFCLLGEEAMALVRQQAEAASDVITKQLAAEIQPQLQTLLRIPRLLVVRVIGCKDLPKGSWADDYDPYVRIRTKKDGRWLQTLAIPNEQNPSWHSSEKPCEFRFLLSGPETDLQAEVMDENSVASDTFIGSAGFPLSEFSENGQWQTQTKALQESTGEVTVECFLATDLENLAQIMPLQPMKQDEEASSDGDGDG